MTFNLRSIEVWRPQWPKNCLETSTSQNEVSRPPNNSSFRSQTFLRSRRPEKYVWFWFFGIYLEKKLEWLLQYIRKKAKKKCNKRTKQYFASFCLLITMPLLLCWGTFKSYVDKILVFFKNFPSIPWYFGSFYLMIFIRINVEISRTFSPFSYS